MCHIEESQRVRSHDLYKANSFIFIDIDSSLRKFSTLGDSEHHFLANVSATMRSSIISGVGVCLKTGLIEPPSVTASPTKKIQSLVSVSLASLQQPHFGG